MPIRDYVDLDIYSNPSKPIFPKELTLQESFAKMANERLNMVKKGINYHFVADNINTNLFWSGLRAAIRDGSLMNKLANKKPIFTNEKGSDIFLDRLYSSIEQVLVQYTSTTPDGKPVIVSGKLFLPPNKKVKNIIIANHYTICSNREAPSQANCIEGIFATKDYIILMPDYIGYGLSDELPHPYLHLDSAVTTSIDLLKAALPYLAERGFLFPKQIILLGYSQGAAVMMAMMKKLEEEYADRFPLRRVFVGAGPYDLATTYDFYVSQPVTAIPCSLPMLIIGMIYGENLPFTREEYFQDIMIEKCPRLIDSKSKTMFEVNDALDHHIDKLLKPIIFQKDQYPTTLLYEAMRKNSMPYWTPKSPMYMFHSSEDDMVPFVNSIRQADVFTSQFLTNIEYDFAPYGSHLNACVTFFEKVYHRLH